MLGESREAAMRAFIAFVILIVLGVAAHAAETITYTYDARGRLIRVSHSGSVNNNIITKYVIDKADNRTNKTTTGSP
jgi:YD repeat-containing protein